VPRAERVIPRAELAVPRAVPASSLGDGIEYFDAAQIRQWDGPLREWAFLVGEWIAVEPLAEPGYWLLRDASGSVVVEARIKEEVRPGERLVRTRDNPLRITAVDRSRHPLCVRTE
jgi:hypothetical protein